MANCLRCGKKMGYFERRNYGEICEKCFTKAEQEKISRKENAFKYVGDLPLSIDFIIRDLLIEADKVDPKIGDLYLVKDALVLTPLLNLKMHLDNQKKAAHLLGGAFGLAGAALGALIYREKKVMQSAYADAATARERYNNLVDLISQRDFIIIYKEDNPAIEISWDSIEINYPENKIKCYFPKSIDDGFEKLYPFILKKWILNEQLEDVQRFFAFNRARENMGKKICPDCGQVGVYQAYVEDGSFGEWCPNCRKGVKGIEGEVYQGTEQIEDFRKLFEMEFNKIISQIRAGNENACPQCGRADLYQSYIEDGGQGKWCPHCNKSVKRMLGEI